MVVGVLVGVPSASGGGFIHNSVESDRSCTAANNGLYLRFRGQRVDGDMQRRQATLTSCIGVIAGSIDGGAFRERILEAVGCHERNSVGGG